MKRIILTLTLAAICGMPHAQSSPTDSLAAQCKKLQVTDFSRIADAPTQVVETKLLPAGDELPALCHADGYINPNVGIELLLPIEKWYFMGCSNGGRQVMLEAAISVSSVFVNLL